MELRVRGYRDRRRLVTPARLLVVVAVVGVLAWKLGPRLRGHKSAPAAKAVVAPPRPVAPAPATPPPRPAEPESRPASAEAAEVKADIAQLSPKFTEAIAAFEQLRSELEADPKDPKVHDTPFKVQQVGAEVDHVPVRSVAARQFQTRFTRTMYDASRLAGELLRAGRSGADLAAKKAELDKTTDLLKTFQTDWNAFSKKYL